MGECFSRILSFCLDRGEQDSFVTIERRQGVTTSTPDRDRTFIVKKDADGSSFSNSLYKTAIASPAEGDSSQEATYTQDMFNSPTVPSNNLNPTQCVTIM